MLRLGVVNYLNAYPLWAAFEEPGVSRNGIELVRGVPSFLAGELVAGRLDAALISSVEYLRHRDEFVYHPELCIAAREESCSIRLFVTEATGPFLPAISRVSRIYTDYASRSSVAQLTVILRHLQLTPELVEVSNAAERIPQLQPREALLAIGDTALANLQRPSYDMQSEYFRLFHHGFVYALWVYRPGLSHELEPALRTAYTTYKANEPVYLRQATERFGFSAEFTGRYLTQVISHVLRENNQADLAFFTEKLGPTLTVRH